MIKITGVKKAVGTFRRANEDGYFSPSYGELMLDRSTGEVWTDTFYSLGHNEYKVYHDPAIINLGHEIAMTSEFPVEINMKIVKETAEKLCTRYEKK